MINSEQLRELIIIPTLRYLEPEITYSEAAVELLMMTCAHESRLGTYIAQVGGPALGIYQMEPATEDDIWTNFLEYKHELSNKIDALTCDLVYSPCQELSSNLVFATAMARVHYYRDKEALPDVEDIEGLARYAKRVYNTKAGKADWRDYETAYLAYWGYPF